MAGDVTTAPMKNDNRINSPRLKLLLKKAFEC